MATAALPAPQHRATDRLQPGTFFGEVVRRRRDPGLTLSEIVHDRPWRLPVHGHAAAGVCLLVEGSYREWAGRHEFDVRPGDAVYHPPEYSSSS
jgi:mannose-6-phosphate isomerase-like protein (cupin superfamily)